MEKPVLIDSLAFYATIADLYDDVASASPAFPSPLLIDSYLTPHMRATEADILDVGIGTGLSSESFIRRGYRVTGVDGSREMLDICAGKEPKARLVQADLTREGLPFPGEGFDAAFCANTLYLLPETAQENVINELHRVTRRGGLYAFNYEPRQPGGLSSRFNDATTDAGRPCVVRTHTMEPDLVRRILQKHASSVVAQDMRTVACRSDGSPIVFETFVCRKPGMTGRDNL